MQNKYFLLLILFFGGISLKAQVKVVGAVIPNGPSDTYPTHYDSLGSGGYVTFATKSARNAIPVLRKKAGMMAYVAETDSVYILSSDKTIWRNFAKGDGSTSGGGGGGSTVFNGSRPILTLPTLNMNYATTDLAGFIDKAFFGKVTPSATMTVTGMGLTAAAGGDVEMRPAGTQNINVNWTITRPANGAATLSATVGSTNITPLPSAENQTTNGTTSVSFNSTFSTTSTASILNFNVTGEEGRNYNTQLTLNFKWKIYYGFLDAPTATPTVDPDYYETRQADIIGLPNQVLGISRLISGSSGASGVTPPTAPKRFVIAYPLAWDNGATATIHLNGLTTDFDRYVIDNAGGFTNASGGQTSYVVYVAKYGSYSPYTFQVLQ